MNWDFLWSNNNAKLSKVRNVYVIRTHLLNDHVQGAFRQMQEQLGKENVFVLFDETKGAPDAPHTKWNAPEGVSTGPAIITINEADCQKLNRLHNEGKLTGSMEKVEAQVCACYRAIRCQYDYLWFIEYDVYCQDYKAALLPFNKVKADMLTRGTNYKYKWWIRTPFNNKKWPHWSKLQGEIAEVPLKKRRGCFFPINRFSKNFLQVLDQNLSKSSGYCEVYFPTLCQANGLKLKPMNLNAFGTFRFKPSLSSEEIQSIPNRDHRLYHPVKAR